ncbi:MAG: protein kinase [Fuerstiella sp.]
MSSTEDQFAPPASGTKIAPARIQSPDSSASALVALLDQYMDDLQAGRNPDRAQLLADHPELATRLEECLDGIEFVHQTSHSPTGTPSELGDFRIVREIGRGGMGVVYEAEQKSLKRRVALKVLRFGGVADAEAVQRFHREAETVAGLDHGNIVPVYSVGIQDGVHYYAMQFIEGHSLAEYVCSRGGRSSGRQPDDAAGPAGSANSAGTATSAAPVFVTSPQQTARWGLSAAQALSHAHRKGVVHRDVKPSNLILDRDGRLWLTDFGLARRDIDTTLSIAGTLLGTPRYMSPEQAAAAMKPMDHRTDIYSLGATLYELTTGEPVFDADTPQGVITQILNNVPRAPRNLDPDLPRDLETIILKCLAREPADRYATAADLAEDLQAFLDDRPIRARRPTVVERTVQALRRHRRVAGAGAISAGIAVLLVVGGLLASQYYAASRLGEVRFTTSGPRMVGEIVDERQQTLIGGFPVPTAEPLKLPAGEYTVRLSADGLLSETWPLEVERGGQQLFDVNFRSRWLWPPLELDPTAWIQVDVLGVEGAGTETSPGGADLLIQSYKTGMSGQDFQTRLRCIDGATGSSAWPQDLILNSSTAPDVPYASEWATMLMNPGVLSDDLNRLVRPLMDLNGDGITDPVLMSRSSPSLLAVSGKDGTPLWWHRARPLLPNNESGLNGRWTSSGGSAVIGQPTLIDADADGTPDVVACFMSYGETFHPASGEAVSSGQQCWIKAVSGRTGESLWTSRISDSIGAVLSSSDAAEKTRIACQIAVARLGQRQVIVTVVARQLLGFDLVSGDEAWTPYQLDFDPYRPPVYRDVNDDGTTDVLFVRSRNDNDLEALAMPLPAVANSAGGNTPPAGPAFATAFRPSEQRSDFRRGRDDWFLVEDLNGDATVEIIFATGKFDGAGGSVGSDGSVGSKSDLCWGGVEMIDGRSGESIWKRRLSVTDQPQPPSVDRLITGPDLNGDGYRDIFASWLGPNSSSDAEWEPSVRVVALSGKDGATLWRWHAPVTRSHHTYDRSGPMRWWQPGPDGWPILVVPVARARGGQDLTWFLSSATGQQLHTLSDVADPRVADFNGDGIRDLLYRVWPQGSPRLLVVKGAPSEPWKRLGEWRPVKDLDHDGSDDFLSETSSTAVSGRDNKLLWRHDTAFDPGVAPLAPPLPFGDLNGDGIPDIVGLQQEPFPQTYASPVAVSGRDGRQLWQGADFGLAAGASGSGTGRRGSYNWPACDWTDLDGDGCAEFLVVHMLQRDRRNHGSSSGQPVLSVLSGQDGRLKWQTPIARGSLLCWPDPYGRKFDDLNRDGTDDIVVWAPVEQTSEAAADRATAGTQRFGGPGQNALFAPRAISGSDGSTLWATPELSVAEQGWLWPRAATGDIDGDGQPEVVVGRDVDGFQRDRGSKHELLVLNGSDGTVKWSYSWYGSSDILPPLLVDFDGDGRHSVCLGLHESGRQREIAVFEAGGRGSHRLPFDLRSNMMYRAALWNVADVDRDGREELLFADEHRLVASRGRVGEEIWSRKLPDRNAVLLVEREFTGERSEAVGPAELILWAGTSVHGLNPKTGESVWRCDGQVAPGPGASRPPQIRLVRGRQSDLPPQIVFNAAFSSGSLTTISRQAWPIDASGHFLPPAPQQRSYEPLEKEPQPRQPLPWINDRVPSLTQHLEGLLIPSGLAMLLMIMLPIRLLRASLCRSTTLTAIAPLLGLCLVSALGVLGPFEQVVSSAIALALPVLLLTRFVKNRNSGDGLLAGIAVVLLCVPLVLLYATPHVRIATRTWAARYWLEELFIEPLMLGLVVGFPGYLYGTMLFKATRQADGKNVRRLLAGATIAALILAAVTIGLETEFRVDQLNYSWNGWYIIWFWGASVTGLLAAVRMTPKAAVNVLHRMSAKTNRENRKAGIETSGAA